MIAVLLRSLTLSSWGVPLLLFIGVDGFLLITDTRWFGELGWTPEWANAGLYLGCALLVGLSAMMSNPFFSRGLRTVAKVTSPLGALRLVLSVAARNLTVPLAGHAVVLVVAIILTVSTGPGDALHWQPFVYALVPIVFFTAFGTAVSAFAPNVVASVLGLAAAYLISYNVAAGLLTLPIMVGGQNASLVGLDYSTSALGVYLIVAGASTAAMLAAAWGAIAIRPAGVATAAFIAGFLAAVVGPSAVGVVVPERFALAATPPALECRGSAPTICLAKGHTRRFAVIEAGIAEATRSFRAAGISFSGARLNELTPQRITPRAGALLFAGSDLNRAAFTPSNYIAALTRPADCDAYYGSAQSEAAERLLTVQPALAEWASGQSEPVASRSRVAKLPQSWALAAYRSLESCSVPPSVLAELR